MDELTVMFWGLFFRGACVMACVVGATYLAYHEKAGWGWLIFTAIVLGSYTYKYTKD